VASDPFPQEGAGAEVCPQMRWRIGRFRSPSACFRRDCTKQTTLSRPGMAAGPGMGRARAYRNWRRAIAETVRCNTEKAAIWVVRDRLREDGSGALLAALTLGELVAWHQSRQHRVTDDFCGDDHLCDVITTGNVVHDIEQDLFEDRPQAAGAGAA
jgi:hypothetical protein